MVEAPVLTPLEASALEMLLAGDDPILAALREQLRSARVRERTRTGVGVFTHFEVGGGAGGVLGPDESLHIADVVARLPAELDTIMFHLAVRSGKLDYLEAATVGDAWPERTIDQAQLMYFDRGHPKGTPTRDLDQARLQWRTR